MEIRTLTFWIRKGCRKPKMDGSARSICSAHDIYTSRRMARDGEGCLFIVDIAKEMTDSLDIGPAQCGRLIIKLWRESKSLGRLGKFKLPFREYDNGKTVAIGDLAIKAIGGAEESIRQWGGRLASQGKVYCNQSKALQ